MLLAQELNGPWQQTSIPIFRATPIDYPRGNTLLQVHKTHRLDGQIPMLPWRLYWSWSSVLILHATVQTQFRVLHAVISRSRRWVFTPSLLVPCELQGEKVPNVHWLSNSLLKVHFPPMCMYVWIHMKNTNEGAMLKGFLTFSFALFFSFSFFLFRYSNYWAKKAVSEKKISVWNVLELFRILL